VVAKRWAKRVKDELKALGWLNSQRKAGPLQARLPCMAVMESHTEQAGQADQESISFPISAAAATQLQLALDSCHLEQLIVQPPPLDAPIQAGMSSALFSLLRDAVAGGQLPLVRQAVGVVNPRKFAVRSPAIKMQESMEQLLRGSGVPEGEVVQLCKELPTKWEKLGDLALIPHVSCLPCLLLSSPASA
jgi:hypothetical protein